MIVQVKEHDVFTVEKSNLKMKKKITLVEALTGYSFSLTHLDSKSYRVQTTPGEVLADKSKRVLVGLGLPKYNK
jgi:DnaJ family protein A protein 2